MDVRSSTRITLASLVAIGALWLATPVEAALRWVPAFTSPYADHELRITCMVEHEGSLYIAGPVLEIQPELNDDPPTLLAQRHPDGTWTSVLQKNLIDPNLGTGMMEVRALLSTDQGLVVGGMFDAIGDSLGYSNVARFDGTAWYPMGDGLPRPPWCFAEHDGQLYAGTYGAGGIAEATLDSTRAVLWRFDGTEWTPLPYIPDTRVGLTRALLSRADGLWVGGSFGTDALPIGVAIFDGATWSIPGGGLRSYQPPLRGTPVHLLQGVIALAEFNGEVIAAGSFRGVEGGYQGISRWMGDSWSTERVQGSVEALTRRAGKLIAVGNATFNSQPGAGVAWAASWDGTDWSGLPHVGQSTPVLDAATCAAVIGDSLFVGGFQLRPLAYMDNRQGLVAHAGDHWSDVFAPAAEVALPSHDRLGALLFENRELYVGGRFASAGGIPMRNIARWKNGIWSSLGQGVFEDLTCTTRLAVSAITRFEGALYVGGAMQFYTEGGNYPIIYYHSIAQWSDGQWHDDSPTSVSEYDRLDQYVAGFVEWNHQLVAYGRLSAGIGDGTTGAGVVVHGEYHWEMPIPGVDIDALIAGQYPTDAVTFEGDLILGGSFLSIGGVVTGGLARWDGSSWTGVLDTPEQFGHLDLAVYQDELYLVGRRALDPEGATCFRVENGRLVPLGWSTSWEWRHLVATPNGLYAISPALARVERDGMVELTEPEIPPNFSVEAVACDPVTGAIAIASSNMLANPPLWGSGLGILREDEAVAVAAPSLAGTRVNGRVRLEWSWPSSWGASVDVRAARLESRSADHPWVELVRFDNPGRDSGPVHWDAPDTSPENVDYRLVGETLDGEIPGTTLTLSSSDVPTSVRTRLLSAFPNPFNPSTTIEFYVGRPGLVDVKIYSIDGRQVRGLDHRVRPVGIYELKWNGSDDAGATVSAGTYIVSLSSADGRDTRKIICVK